MRWAPDEFGRGASDEDWLRQAAARKPPPVLIGGDGRILKNKVECKALKDSGLSYVYLESGWTNLDWDTFAWKIIKAWPSIVENVRRVRKPTLFTVSVGNLKVTAAGPTRDL